ncbi:MAG: prolipoprotein diacylglyceryl transferase [Acidimicrobiia bacterium]|nr:MAG: prolipoprotein diacylglyceryl transferase [Acidimicrobiia bacterium]
MISMLGSIPSPPQNTLDIGPLTIYFYGILIAIGVIVAVVVAKLRYARFGGVAELVERVSIWAVIIGFLGARTGYVITHSGNFTDRPWAVLFIWEGGLALYGGLIAGALAAIFLMRRWRGDVFAFGDAVAIGVPLAQVIGRFGNYFNQELFGRPSTLPWAVEIDPVNRPFQYADFATFHPTFLYEALWNLLLTVGVILWLERRGKLFKGSSIALYLVVYGTGRFLMELLRTDTTFRFAGLSRNGWVSMLAVAVGLVALYWFQHRGETRTLVGPPSFLAPGEATVDVAVSTGTEPEDAELPSEETAPPRE